MDINNVLKYLTEINTVSPSKCNIRKIQAQITQLSHYSLKGNDEDIVFMKCILKYVDIIVNLASNKSFKDQMKICKKSFLLIVGMISKEMQHLFMKETTQRIFDIIIDDDLQNWCTKRELLKMFIKCIENSDRNLRQEAVQALPQIYLFKLMDTVSTCGDFDFQLSLIEVVFRMYGKAVITSNLKDLIPESQDLSECFANISAETFDESVRKFLNSLNATSGKVFSVICRSVYLGNIRCERPIDGIDGLWVDFNLSENAISWYCDKTSFEKRDSESGSVTESNDKVWNLVTFFTSDVESVQIHRPVKSDSILIYIKLKDSCLSSSDENQMIVGAADNVKLIVPYNSNNTTTLLSKILPSLFGPKYSHTSTKVSSSKKIYKPLKITVCKRGKSELSKSKSDTSSFVTFFDPLGRLSKSDVNSSSRDEASFRKTVSVSSASTKCEVISISDSSEHTSDLSLELLPLRNLKYNVKHQDTENSQYETADACHELHIDRKTKVSQCITSIPIKKEEKELNASKSSGAQKKITKESIDLETPEFLSQSVKISTNIFVKKSRMNSVSPPKPQSSVFLSTLDEGLYSVEEDINHIQILSGRCSGSNKKYSQLSRSSAMTTSTPRKLSDHEIKSNLGQIEKVPNSSTENFETARDCDTEATLPRNSQNSFEDFTSLKVNIFKHKGTVLSNTESFKVSSNCKSQPKVSGYFQQQYASCKTEDNVIVISEDYVEQSENEKRLKNNQESGQTEEVKTSKEVCKETFTKVSKSLKVESKKRKNRMVSKESKESSSEDTMEKVTRTGGKVSTAKAIVNTSKTEDNAIVMSEDYVKQSEDLFLTSRDERLNKKQESVETEEAKMSEEACKESFSFTKISKSLQVESKRRKNRMVSRETSSEDAVEKATCTDSAKVSKALYKATNFSSDLDSEEDYNRIKISKPVFIPVETKSRKKNVSKKNKDEDVECNKITKDTDISDSLMLPVEKVTQTVKQIDGNNEKIIHGDGIIVDSKDCGTKIPMQKETNVENSIKDDSSKHIFNTDGSKLRAEKKVISPSSSSIRKMKKRGKRKKKCLSAHVTKNLDVLKTTNDNVFEDTGVDLPSQHDTNDDVFAEISAIESIITGKTYNQTEDPKDNLKIISDNNILGDTGIDLPSPEINDDAVDNISPVDSLFFEDSNKNSKAVEESKKDLSTQPDVIEQTEDLNGNVQLSSDIVLKDDNVNDLPTDEVNVVPEICVMRTEIIKPSTERENQTKENEVTEEKFESQENLIPKKVKGKGQARRRIICESDESEITGYKSDNSQKGIKKNRKKRRTICESDDSDTENIEVYSNHERSITSMKVVPELYVKLPKIELPQKTEHEDFVILETQNLNHLTGIATDNGANQQFNASGEYVLEEKMYTPVEVKSKIAVEEINEEKLISQKSLEAQKIDIISEFDKILAFEDTQANVIRKDVHQDLPEKKKSERFIDDKKRDNKQLANKSHEKTVEEKRNDMSLCEQTLSTTLGGKKRRKLYNPQDLSYWENDKIMTDSVIPLNEPSVVKDIIELNSNNESIQETAKVEKSKGKRSRKENTGKNKKPSHKESNFKRTKKIKFVNPDYMLEVPTNKDRQRYSHLRPVFHDMVASFRHQTGNSFLDILEKNTPKEPATNKKIKKKNVRKYTKRTMKQTFITDNIVRVPNKSISSSSDISFTLRKKRKPSDDTPYNSPVNVELRAPANQNLGAIKKINIISDIQIRPKRVLLDGDNDVSKRIKYDEHVKSVAFSQGNIQNDDGISQAIYNGRLSGVVPLDEGLPIIAENITKEEISSWIATGTPKYNKLGESRFVLRHVYPMFKSLLSSAVGQEHEDISKICDILKKYV